MSDTLLTPVGTISSMALKRASQKTGKKYIRLQFKDGDHGVDEFKAALVAINPKKIIDTSTNPHVPKGYFQVNLSTKGDFNVEVLDANGDTYDAENVPTFSYENDTGKAQAVGTISTTGMQPTLYLKAVKITELNQAPRTPDSNMAALRGTLDEIHNS